MKKFTIQDVARKAGVSKGTVSAVINGKSSVKSSTRAHVIEVMKALNFRPKGQARNLKGQTVDKSIGLIIRELDNPFFTALASGVKEQANSMGYVEFIASSESSFQDEARITQLFADKDVKGVIIAPVFMGSREIEHLLRLELVNYPFVLLADVEGIDANVVSINNTQATFEAVDYLIKTGHTHIVHFSGPEHTPHSHDRLLGFREAHIAHGRTLHESQIVSCGSKFKDGYATGLAYFQDMNPSAFPMAVVCFNDVVALGLISALQRLDIRIPEDVSIIGNDDIEFASHWMPDLTTIHAPIVEMGRRAAELLIKNIESEHILPIEKLELRSELQIRSTTRKLNQGR